MAYHMFILQIGKQGFKAPRVLLEDEFDEVMGLLEWRMPYRLRAFHFNDMAQQRKNPVVADMPPVDLSVADLFTSHPAQPMRLRDRQRRDTAEIFRKCGDYVLARTEDGYGRLYRVDGTSCSIVTRLNAVPITLKQAREYVQCHHRHCEPPKFHKFSVCLRVNGEPEPVGVAIASTPKARAQDDNRTLEINRCCADPRYFDVCSRLYGMAIRAGRELGYTRFLTYTLPEESGSSPKAVGFRLDGMTQNTSDWSRPSRPREDAQYPAGSKLRWILNF